MEVILKQDVKNLGDKDDVVSVKPGYGRNFLIPKGFAQQATESARKVLAENLKQAAFKQEKIRKDADAIAAKLEGVKLTIGAKAGETGKIFGAINTIQIADALKKEGFEVDRRRITLVSDAKFDAHTFENLNLPNEKSE